MPRTLAFDGHATVPQHAVAELIVAPPTTKTMVNPFDVAFAAAFAGPHGDAISVPVFHDARTGYVMPFSPTLEGAG